MNDEFVPFSHQMQELIKPEKDGKENIILREPQKY